MLRRLVSVQIWSLITLVIGLCIGLLLNAAIATRVVRTLSVDDSRYTYLGDDYPAELPLRLDTVAMTWTDSEEYSLTSKHSWAAWTSLFHFRHNEGYVRLGPEGRMFGIAMFHQLHCLNHIRQAVIVGRSNIHTRHCFSSLRNAILCASNTALVALDDEFHGEDGGNVTHVCRDWTQVYAFVVENHKQFAAEERWPPPSLLAGNYTELQ